LSLVFQQFLDLGHLAESKLFRDKYQAATGASGQIHRIFAPSVSYFNLPQFKRYAALRT
jgi:hypothetical protein